MFSTIKVWLYGLLGLLVAGLGIAVKVLTTKNSRLTRKLDTAEARVHHAKVVEVEKKVHHEERISRKAEIAKEIEEKKSTNELTRPNDKW